MDRLLTSLRYTIRLLLKSPGFAITAILILGFGIGVNAAIFSLIDSVLLQRDHQVCTSIKDPFLAAPGEHHRS